MFAFRPPDGGWFSGSSTLTSPFQADYLTTFATSWSSLAYFPLLGLTVLSFLLVLPRVSWQRLLPSLAWAVLSVLHFRAIPFFAVVAGPILARNVYDFLERYGPERRETAPWRRGLVALRGLATIVGLVVIVCAWPGWLQGPPYEPRRWDVEPAPAPGAGSGGRATAATGRPLQA